jgi:putative DNA primase/helicase
MIEAARAKAKAERRAEHEARAIEARREWSRTVIPDPAHPYLRRQGREDRTTCASWARG